jgi:hypothetical protein
MLFAEEIGLIAWFRIVVLRVRRRPRIHPRRPARGRKQHAKADRQLGAVLADLHLVDHAAERPHRFRQPRVHGWQGRVGMRDPQHDLQRRAVGQPNLRVRHPHAQEERRRFVGGGRQIAHGPRRQAKLLAGRTYAPAERHDILRRAEFDLRDAETVRL